MHFPFNHPAKPADAISASLAAPPIAPQRTRIALDGSQEIAKITRLQALATKR
jgi:hypothetical protein